MYDLAIIGGGSAGYSAAFEAVNRQLKVVLFENSEIGGTCLNRGCVPTKYLSHSARLFRDIQSATSQGIINDCPPFAFSAIQGEMNRILQAQRSTLHEALSEQIDLVSGTVSVVDNCTLVCDNVIYEARNILIATGSKPSSPLLPEAITSDELLKTEQVPSKLHILGGGTIAVEFANIYRAFGTDVTIYIRGDRILRKWDREIATSVTQSFKKKGIIIRKNCDFSALGPLDGVIFSAAGRVPVLPQMPMELVDLGETGGIVTDNYGQTKTNGIYAAGDVRDKSPQLAHIAMAQGRDIVRRIVGMPAAPEAEIVRCLYLDQESASVGLDEQSASNAGIEYLVGKANMYTNARTMISTTERGFVKILAEKCTGRIIGAQLMCERAGDIIAELALAVNRGITCQQMIDSIRPHPSYCEAVTDALRSLETKLCTDI